ncbi:MAG: hypothetical protein A2626_00825 [Candidatus Nealsonbacteria bacterium RIFCSPHIGHO2_01_FULL_38_55]|uniref:Uncharacterized protein n=2 Tax=Candidatus Nealsoniibacteriota TaxID=1817911 RepID=A0A1G2EJ44_9BACT|nr:MAG: hypothetical protein US88_C0003G0045 [Parcubacteria group bacterium GW2011_GWA2_38_27]KKQ98496.1 MAG: hypothetical protein UT22_C0002G0031 [Parcubacteria group bacterium GW2011_GWC2_39_11]OGZ19962.1 MAG: hypothetical protein A2626_00825 [Candidatus Nealsonbacteria bacterium RIFCSPHIGHO2_01_FULL_38_55]OGZ20548.1 MAG: hypothetical protein A2W55_01965 [Candidatus Nealsonbacteria bacterium RIFCSPHIGHO2_02_38_10]OGZ22024.1 MAG: hypothetical protein A3C48_03395 [Candidatus Nealsonbacteria bac
MDNEIHKGLAGGRWNNYSKEIQILNIAAELSRTKNWLLKGDAKEAGNCLVRALELTDLTINDRKWRGPCLKELLRWRGVLAEFYINQNKDVSHFLRLLRILLYFNKFTSQVEV